MNQMKIIILVISVILATIGVILIYDARKITKKLFSVGNQNESTKILKICGFVIFVIAGLIINIIMFVAKPL